MLLRGKLAVRHRDSIIPRASLPLPAIFAEESPCHTQGVPTQGKLERR